MQPPFEQAHLEHRQPWRKNRRLIKDGFKDLAYLPRAKAGWNATLAGHAFSARRRLVKRADLNLWAAMHGCPPSARYAAIREHALVFWHGTSARRAEKIREVGLFSKKGVWASLEPVVAHSYTRSRDSAYRAGSATIVLVFDRREVSEGQHYEHDNEQVVRFFTGVAAEAIEYILFDDRIEFCGNERAEEPRSWGVARFKRQAGRWVPRSRPPVRLDDDRTYSTFHEWLDLSVTRILRTLGSAAAIEVFSSLYATLDPWDALEHEVIFDALERLCLPPRRRLRHVQFQLAGEA